MIRPAQAEDAPAVAALWSGLIRDTSVTFNALERAPEEVAETIAQAVADDRPFLVAEHSGAVAGFATYFQFRAGVGYRRTMEHSIMLAPEARGLGLGRALMTALIEHATARGVHSLWAGVSGENPAGVGFHEALGFVRVATLPEVGYKFGRYMDLVLLMRQLDPNPADRPKAMG